MSRALSMVVLLLAAASCGKTVERVAPQYPAAPVIIISIDSLRADRLPMFGYQRVATPHLDRLRSDAILYTNAYTHVPLTLPAHVSLLTGLLPYAHGVRNDFGSVLRDGTPTLQRSLKAQGYATAAAVSSYLLRGSTGLAQDFDEYDDRIAYRREIASTHLERSGRVTTAIASQWIESRPPGERFFYFLHVNEPHAPYAPEPRFRSRYRDAYDGEIATMDAIVGEFLDRLRSSGLYEKAIIVLLSDHGEALGEHGEPDHGVFLYRATTHVPLLLKLPGGDRRGESVATPVGLVDVAPTVAALTGLSPLVARHGRSMLELPAQRRIYVESRYPPVHLGWSELRSLAGGRYQYIDAPSPELYELYDDPRQKRNIVEEEGRVAARMRGELAGYRTNSSGKTDALPVEALPDPKDGIGEMGAIARAGERMQARRWDEAASAFRAITAKNPRSTEAWSQLGRALESGGRHEEAGEVYGHLIELTPELAGEFGLRRAAVLLELERFEEAEKHARLAESTNRGGMHVLLARIELVRQNFGAAEAQARAAANDRNHRLDGELLLALIGAQQGRAPEAWLVVERAGEVITTQGLAPFESYELARGEVLSRLGRHDEAVEALRREIEDFPHQRRAYVSLSLLYRSMNRREEATQTLEQMVRANRGTSVLLLAARTAGLLGDEEAAERWRLQAAAAE